MIVSEIINDIKAIDTSPRKIRDFGITFFVILALIGGALLYKGHGHGYLLIGLGVLFLVAGLWVKSSLRALYKVWMGLAVVIGFFMSRIVLCVLFYVVLTPLGLVMRAFGKDLLNERWDHEAKSYWIRKESQPFDKKRYEKLF